MILIGSRAFAFNYKDFKRTNLMSDYDLIMKESTFKEWFNLNRSFIKSSIPTSENKYKVVVFKDNVKVNYEIEIVSETDKESSNSLLFENLSDIVLTDGIYKGFLGEKFQVMNGRFLGLTKKSHITYPIHFEKNMIDLQAIMRNEGTKFISTELSELELLYLKRRIEETKLRNPQKTPNLNVSTEDFFSSKLPVDAYFVHDDLHNLMAHRDKPIFEMMQSDNSKAWCEKDMFFRLPFEYRLEAVVEEAYVIAMERYIIPQYGKDLNNHFICFKKAVQRICTTLTSGWFREFAIQNYSEVLSKYDENFTLKFINAYNNGLIKPKDEFKDSLIPFVEELKKINIL